MELFLNILYQPVLACLFIFVKAQKNFLLVQNELTIKRALNMAHLGDLLTWVVVALAVIAGIYLIVKFILANALPEVGGAKEFYAMLSGVLSRLGVVLVLYLILAAFLYVFFNGGTMILQEMESKSRLF